MLYAFLSPARVELQEAVDFYNTQRSGLGEEFASEVRHTISRILGNPTAWPKLSLNVRRCRVTRFAYGVIYQI